MIVVLSLSQRMRLATPNCSIVVASSFMPSSSEITVEPVNIAMSSSIALRRSPKPGALTATIFKFARKRLRTRAARASPSTSSAIIKSGLPVRTTFSRIGTRSFNEESFLSKIRTKASS